MNFDELRDSVLQSFSNFCKKNYNSGNIEHENNVFDTSGLKSYEKTWQLGDIENFQETLQNINKKRLPKKRDTNSQSCLLS